MKERQLRSAALAMILLIFFSWASWEIFRHQNSDYIKWYVQNGSTIALIMGLVSLAIDLDRLPGLISLRPDIFIATAVKVVFTSNLGTRDELYSDRLACDSAQDSAEW
jgi:hypothetical protein